MTERRAFRLFLVAKGVSWVGSSFTLVALPVLMYQRTGSAALTGLLVALEAAPYLVLGLPAGALADRWDKRRTMVASRVLSGLAVASVPVASALDVLSTVQLLVVAALIASLFVFDDAAGFGALPEIIGRDGLAAALGTMATVGTLIGFIGPAVGGALSTTIGAANVLALDAVTWFVSAAVLAGVRWVPPPAPDAGASPGRMRRDIAEGVRFIRDHDVIRTLTVMGAGLSLSLGAVTGLLVVHGVEHLGLTDDDPRLGLLYAATSLGALLVSIALARVQRRFRTGTITLVAFAVNWVGVAVWALVPSVAIGLAVLVVWQGAGTLAILNGIVVRQSVTPAHLQSRVNTTARMIAWGGTPFGAALAGVLAQRYGTPVALLVTSVPVIASLVVGLHSGLWRIGRLATLTPEATTPSGTATDR